MKGENTFKKIKVYCYEHQTTFEAASKPQIICTIEEHSLSNGFPNTEFWEFCCDCDTFFPSKSDVTGDVLRSCPNCDRPSVRHFICQGCNTAAFESDEPSRGKTYRLNSSNGIEPICPGCKISTEGIEILPHDCKAIDVQFFTARETCPFCLKATTKAVKRDRGSTTIEVCPKCKSEIASGSAFCSKCKYRLRSEIGIEKLGTNISKRQLLGSLCPNCSTPIPPDSEFCGECGQAVVKTIPPPPPPPLPKEKQIVGAGGHGTSNGDPSAKPIIKAPKPAPTLKIVAAIGAGLVLLIAIVMSINTWSKSQSGSNTKPIPGPSATPYTSSSTSALPPKFDWTFSGTIGRKSIPISISLVKNGSVLSGSASTTKTDILEGTIDSYGRFELTGREDGDESKESQYSGSISTDGRITGNWKMMDGTRETAFSLTRN